MCTELHPHVAGCALNCTHTWQERRCPTTPCTEDDLTRARESRESRESRDTVTGQLDENISDATAGAHSLDQVFEFLGGKSSAIDHRIVLRQERKPATQIMYQTGSIFLNFLDFEPANPIVYQTGPSRSTSWSSRHVSQLNPAPGGAGCWVQNISEITIVGAIVKTCIHEAEEPPPQKKRGTMRDLLAL